jgi:hypothetical protein
LRVFQYLIAGLLMIVFMRANPNKDAV